MKSSSVIMRGGVLPYLLLGVALICFLIVVLKDIQDDAARERDIVRISDINRIHYALDQYYDRNGTYPACLYASHECTTLEGTFAMTAVPIDPLTNGNYTYAAMGSGSQCTSYHLGISLERASSQALLTGSDAPPHPANELCRGSHPDFSGLSYGKGGELCNAIAGIAQPTHVSNGETCFDLQP